MTSYVRPGVSQVGSGCWVGCQRNTLTSINADDTGCQVRCEQSWQSASGRALTALALNDDRLDHGRMSMRGYDDVRSRCEQPGCSDQPQKTYATSDHPAAPVLRADRKTESTNAAQDHGVAEVQGHVVRPE